MRRSASRVVSLVLAVCALVAATSVAAAGGGCHAYPQLTDAFLAASRDAVQAAAHEIERQRRAAGKGLDRKPSRPYCNALSAAMARGDELGRFVAVNGPACRLPPLPADTLAGIDHTAALWKSSCDPLQVVVTGRHAPPPAIPVPTPPLHAPPHHAPPLPIPAPPAYAPGPPLTSFPAPLPVDPCLVEAELVERASHADRRVFSAGRHEYEVWSLTARESRPHFTSRRYCDALAERVASGAALASALPATAGRCETGAQAVSLVETTAAAEDAFHRYCRRREAFVPR